MKSFIDEERFKKNLFFLNKREIRKHAEGELKKIRREKATKEARANWWARQWLLKIHLNSLRKTYETRR